MSNDKKNLPASLVDYLLPSDSQCRADMTPLKAKDYDEAERQKYAMEESQRRDKKLR